jgi:hypothetical protein
MTSTKKNPTDPSRPRGGVAPVDPAAIPNLTNQERAILDELNGGGLVSGRALAQVAGVEPRWLRSIVWRLRSVHRVPILGWPGKGYQIARDQDDVRKYLALVTAYGRDYFALASLVEGVTVDVAAAQAIMDLFPGRANETAVAADDTARRKAWEVFVTAGKRQLNYVDVLAHMIDRLKNDPELLDAERGRLETDHGVLILSPSEAQDLRQAQKALARVGRKAS